ncbi:conserved Plasmodium protein, unknown function [Plasmodium berghei]|uniref:Calponin-homology (CH) domain-containing protein n=2 Tax=Plasmodium berghei TaxID=5821 RepID=A0A509AUI8_PLABA|nr:conserved Plasmodium protein, unknown function [Plasmodium berghei ANKA]CXI78541.1 conserved Plasmodium protein, unknown function [Plasmodium berghei]SCM25192.1 conserved Plasmodium protein, unknown function [Plasmodium berghei]SCN27291.1 conserved Plasmodium protein, unknown function [Plasmodium berghei]SCO61905.1 conserved Plasmodium protein, unknown function [Plasmodium berghei]SCO63717.1 conserved Plasmodium protein, unknown function [Plasmodium berghei]|eukprot:XP_034422927.1 conserved Plasmodium protein, unknown function [Plasmodium berghei ANKA]
MIVNYENKGQIYNDITKSTWYAKNKENLNKAKYLEIDSFSVIIDWINSLLISNNILNGYNLYEEIKDGVIILKLIQIYNPEIEIRGIFLKALKKKCAMKNLEKALSIIYMNNPYYYSMVSSTDIYEKKKKKVNILLIQLFDKFEFQNLKNISTPLLNWYNYTLKKMKLPLYSKTINNPFHIINNKSINFCNEKEKYLYAKKGIEMNIQKDNTKEDITIDGNMNKKKILNIYPNYVKEYKIITQEKIKNKSNALKNFVTYILYKDKEKYQNDVPYIVKDFSDCKKIFFILYRYGYICIEELQIVTKSNRRNNFFFLQELLRKLNIPIILKSQYLNNPSEVAILLQLKYIQCFIHNNGYSKAIDLKKNYFYSIPLHKKKDKISEHKKCGHIINKCSSDPTNYNINILLNDYTKNNYNRNYEQKDKQFLNVKLNGDNEKDINDDHKNDVYEKVEYKTCKEIPNSKIGKINQVSCYSLSNGMDGLFEGGNDWNFNSSIKIYQNKKENNYKKNKERKDYLQEKKENMLCAHQNEKDNFIPTHKYLEKEPLTITPIKMLRKMFHKQIKENMNIDKGNTIGNPQFSDNK